MKILLLVAFLALAKADVSHLVNQGYHYQNPAPQNAPQSSYGVPQGSVLGSSVQTVSGSASVPQLSLPSSSGPSIGFSSVGNLPSNGLTIQSYNSFAGSVPSNAGIQVAAPTPNLDLSGFQVASNPSAPSVNLVQYSQPSSQPSSSFQFLSQLSNGGLSSGQFGSDASLNSASSGSDLTGFLGNGANQVSSVSSGTGVSGFGSSSVSTGGSSSSQVSSNFVGGRTSGGSLDDAFGVVTDSAQGASGVNQQASEVSKHLYFFAAPEEEEEVVQPKIELPPTPPKKTYKIIFIKAPTYRNQGVITIPAPPQNEEKTLVYVLVKKPEAHPQVKFQNAAPTQPSKPEVFFIKYKTQQEAEAAVAEIQSKHGASGQVIANLPAGSQLAASLQAGSGVSESGYQPLSGPNGFSSDSTSFESRISGVASQESSSGGDSGPSQSEEAVVTPGYGGISQSPTPVSFGQSSVDSLQVFGGGIAPSQPASVSSESSFVNVESSGAQENVDDHSNVSSNVDEAGSSGGEVSVSGNSQDSNTAQNVIEQRVGGVDSDGQGTQISGFARYGPPNY